MNSPFYFLSVSVMVLSTLMAVSSSNWIFLWAGMELNLLSFLPVLMMSKLNQETEASIKYFLAQALGSSVMLMSSISMWFLMSSPSRLIDLMLLLSIVIKLGMAPCHAWYPSVMVSVSWMSCLVLSTWQKLAPLMMMSFLMIGSGYMLMALAPVNALVGGILGMNQSHLRSIMAYSSITHMGWMMALSSLKFSMSALVYFFMYSVLIIPIFILFEKFSVKTSASMNNCMLKYPLLQFIVPVLLLSLGGMPPFTGFIPKWMAISLLSSVSPYILILLIVGSMMNMYYYLNISFNFLLSPQMSGKLNVIFSSNLYSSVVAISGLFLAPVWFLIYAMTMFNKS